MFPPTFVYKIEREVGELDFGPSFGRHKGTRRGFSQNKWVLHYLIGRRTSYWGSRLTSPLPHPPTRVKSRRTDPTHAKYWPVYANPVESPPSACHWPDVLVELVLVHDRPVKHVWNSVISTTKSWKYASSSS
jgi:hypothetical protein